MCIVCAIKADLSAAKVATEQAQAIVEKVMKLADGLSDVLEVTQDVHNAKPGTFNDEQVSKLQAAADLLNADKGEGAGIIGLLLAAILGGAKIETHHIELRDGESPEDAIARHLGERGEQPTKH